MAENKQSLKIDISAQDRASVVINQVSKKLDSMGKSISSVASAATGISLVAGGAGLGAFFASGVKSAGDFEYALYQLTKVTDESLEEIRQKIQDLPTSLGSYSELAGGYYQTMSAGVTDSTKALETLSTASKLAAVAEVSQGDAIKALTKMMAGFRGEIENVNKASDILLDIEQLGQTNVAELIPVIGDLAGISSMAGVKVEEMAGALSLLTQTAGSTSQAATQLSSLESELIKPNAELQKLIEALGYKTGNELIGKNGLIGALSLIEQGAKASGREVSSFIGSKEAIIAFGNLSALNFGLLAQVISDVGTKAGRTDESFKKYQETLKGTLSEASSSISNFTATFGEGFLPVVVSGVQDFTRYVQENNETIRQWGVDAGNALGSIMGGVESIINIWRSLPEDITGPAAYGIIGSLLFGRKAGFLLAAAEATGLINSLRGALAVIAGEISFGDYAMSNRQELEDLLNNKSPIDDLRREKKKIEEEIEYFKTPLIIPGFEFAYQPGSEAPYIAEAKTRLAEVTNKLIAESIKPAQVQVQNALDYMAKEQAKSLKIVLPTLPVMSTLPKLPTNFKPVIAPVKGDGKSKIDTARMRADLEKEVNRLTLSKEAFFEYELEEKITKLKKDIPEAIGLINQFAEASRAAFAADMQKGQVAEQKKKQEELEASQKKDLQVSQEFYKELARLAGDYTQSNKLYLDEQVENFRQARISEVDIQKWAELTRLETSRNWDDGIIRAATSYSLQATDAAAQMETAFTEAFTTIGNIGGTALAEIFETGEFNMGKFFASLTRQLAIQMANAATNQLVGGILGLISSGISSWMGGGIGGLSSSVGKIWGGGGSIGSKAFDIGNLLVSFVKHTGGYADGTGTTRMVSPLLFANAPRYHSGGYAGLLPNEVPAILKRNELVLTEQEAPIWERIKSMQGSAFRGNGSSGAGEIITAILQVLQSIGNQQQSINVAPPQVVVVDDASKINKYMYGADGQRAFISFLNNNRAAVVNVAYGGRA